MVVRIVNELYSSNTYLIYNDLDNKCIIIDPGSSEKDIDQKIIELKLIPVAILATHGHFDHISSVAYFNEKYEVPFYIHEADIKLMKSANFFLKMSKINKMIKICEPNILVTGSYKKESVEGVNWEFFNFPGHTNGSCIIRYGNNIFTGDTIYKEKLLINNLPGENIEKLKISIAEILKMFDSNDICYPGHGSEASLEFIKLNNYDLVEFLKS